MASLYSTRLWVPTYTTPAATQVLVYTVPAGKRVIIHRVSWLAVIAGANTNINFLPAGGPALPGFHIVNGAAALTDWSYMEWQVLNAGDQVRIFSSLNFGAAIGASGYVLPA